MLKCREVAEESGEYIDHTLPWHKTLAVKVHLLLCVRCRRFVSHLRTAVAFFHYLPGPRIPDKEARDITDAVVKTVTNPSPVAPDTPDDNNV